MFKQIGEEKILGFKLNENWTKADLHDNLIILINRIEINPKNYTTFYLKLFGKYDKSIIDCIDEEENNVGCFCCPNNPKYEKYWQFNQLKNDKVPVLVLVSKYIDFKDYSIYAAYYTDKISNESDNIEMWGNKKSFMNIFTNFLGLTL